MEEAGNTNHLFPHLLSFKQKKSKLSFIFIQPNNERIDLFGGIENIL